MKLLLFLFVLLCHLSISGREYQGDVRRQGEEHVLSKGDFSVTVSASKGGRIISLKRKGEEMLLQDTIHPKYYGATLWPSPQCCFWPPSPVLDEYPYQVTNNGDSLYLVSRNDSLTGLRFTKNFSISQDTALTIAYRIENISDTVRHVAAWDVVRVLGGTTFFLVKERELTALSSDLEQVVEENGVLWYISPKKPIKKGQKLFATTAEGWLAHQCGNLLFIKVFPIVPQKKLPFKQGEVEIFLAPNSLYVELENHGNFTALQPGASLSYKQKWYLCGLKKEMLHDKAKLVDYVRHRLALR